MDIWLSLIWLVATFLVMLWLRRWIETHMQGVAFLITGHQTVATWIFFLVFLPGILVHELSHWLTAKVLFVPTGHITIWPQVKRGNSLWLGTVQVGQTDPLRGSLIGLAPLVCGSVLVVLIGAHLQLDILGQALISGKWDTAWGAVEQSIRMPDFWLWAYLLFAIANRMLPSPTDRQPWIPVLIFLTLLSAALIVSGRQLHLNPGVQNVILDVISFLLFAFSLAVVIDLIVALVLVILENVVVLIRQERVSY